MQIAPLDSRKFERLLNRLARDIVDAAIFNRLHIDLSTSADEFWREFAQSRTFWSLTFQAYIEVVLFRLIRVYDTHKGALSLQTLLQMIKRNLHSFDAEHGAKRSDVVLCGADPPDLDQLNRDIDSVTRKEPLIRKLISLRHKIIAHIDETNIVGELGLESRFSLTYDEIDELVSRAMTILNRYSVLFKHQFWSSSIIGHDDFRNILKALRADLERRDVEMADEIARSTRVGHA